MPNYGKRPVRLPSFPGGRTSLPFVRKLLSDDVSAVLCALVFLREPMGALEWLGAVLIIGGAAIGSVPKRPPRGCRGGVTVERAASTVARAAAF